MLFDEKLNLPHGKIALTPNARAKIPGEEVISALLRHLQGDEGELAQFPVAAKQRNMSAGARRLSVFRTRRNLHFWIVTEADGELTTVLLPEDL